MAAPAHIKELLAHGARLKIKATSPALLKEYIQLAVQHDGHIEIVGGTAPGQLLEFVKLGGKHVTLDLSGE